jgi:ABC-2 type transport system permease protein
LIALLLRSAARARFVLLGGGLLLFLFQIVIIGHAAEIQSTNAFSSIGNLMPSFLQRGMGNRIMLLATFKGTVAFGYFHPVVCLLISAIVMYITTEVAHEIEAGLVDLELARAMPRRRLLTRSLLLAHGAVSMLLVAMAVGTWLGIRVFDAAALEVPPVPMRLELLVNLFALASCFSALALLVASSARRWAPAFTAVALTSVVSYIVDFLALGWTPIKRIAWLSPFHYYPALWIVAGDADTVRNLAVLFTASAAMSAAAYWQFQRRDL